MKILSIDLRTPDLPSLAATGVLGLVIVTVAAVLITVGAVTVSYGASIASCMIGGSLANAYGASVKASGWRGAVVSTAFSLGLMALVQILMWASE